MRKTFTVKSMGKDTMDMIKRELGEDAVILKSTPIEVPDSSAFGLFSKRGFIIEAGDSYEERPSSSGKGRGYISSYQPRLGRLAPEDIGPDPDDLTNRFATIKDQVQISQNNRKNTIKPPGDRKTKLIHEALGRDSRDNRDSQKGDIASTSPNNSVLTAIRAHLNHEAASKIDKALCKNADLPLPQQRTAISEKSPQYMTPSQRRAVTPEKNSDPVAPSPYQWEGENMAKGQIAIVPDSHMVQPPHSDGIDEDLIKKISLLKEEMAALKQHIMPKNSQPQPSYSPYGTKLMNMLSDSSISRDKVAFIVEKCERFAHDKARYLEELRRTIAELMPADEVNFHNKDSGPHIMTIIGPTGSGKSTTLTKLAAYFSLQHHMSISFITTDSTRMAAPEQLRPYASILGLDVKLVLTPKDMRQTVEENKDKDLILVDTAGRNYKDEEEMAHLANFVSKIDNHQIFLTINASTRPKEMKLILENYKIFNYDRIIITKVDETTNHFGFLEVFSQESKPISFITNGQSIPDDIREAKSTNIADLMLTNFRL